MTFKYSLLFLALSIGICSAQNSFPALQGEYLGQPAPGMEPELFAPGVVATGMYTRDIAMTPDGNEIYFCVSIGYNTILFTKQVNGIWTKPEVASFATDPRYMHFEPHISPDGKKLYFLSNRPKEKNQEHGDEDIWVVDRVGDSWSEPYNLGTPINSDANEFFPSVTENGTMYFTRQEKDSRTNYIYRSHLVEGKYTEPEKLGLEVNCGKNQFNAFVARDESFVIVPAFGREDSFGSTDYYIVFRDKNDKWSQPINLGDKINSPRGGEFSPYISPDGKYFFFMSNRTLPEEKEPEHLSYDFLVKMYNSPQNGNSDIYWVDAEVIYKLKPSEFY